MIFLIYLSILKLDPYNFLQAFTEQGVKYEKIPIEGEMVPKKARVEK